MSAFDLDQHVYIQRFFPCSRIFSLTFNFLCNFSSSGAAFTVLFRSRNAVYFRFPLLLTKIRRVSLSKLQSKQLKLATFRVVFSVGPWDCHCERKHEKRITNRLIRGREFCLPDVTQIYFAISPPAYRVGKFLTLMHKNLLWIQRHNCRCNVVIFFFDFAVRRTENVVLHRVNFWMSQHATCQNISRCCPTFSGLCGPCSTEHAEHA